MKLHQLGLIRYGAFTDRVLDFDPASRLTIVHGGNEAGKSTALQAVADVLFDIEERSRYNFLHDYRDMRLTATVAAPDGQRLSFARLKRRNHKIVDPNTDTPLGDDCLAAFIGLHDRRAFLDIFGLNQASLREGGRKLLAGGGDLANTLLAAAPGLGHVVATRDRLKDSAATIFNPARRNSSHLFHVAKDRLDAARRAVREAALGADEARRLRESARAAQQARQAAVLAEQQAGSDLARAQALRAASRDVRVLDGHIAARHALGSLNLVTAENIAGLRALFTAWTEAGTAMETARIEAEAARDALGAITVDDGVLAMADLIRKADEDRVAVENELKSLPNRRAEAGEARAALARNAADLGLAGADAFGQGTPSSPLLARCEALADRLHAVDARLADAARDEAGLAERRRVLEDVRQTEGEAPDPAPLRLKLAALDGAEERERALREAEHARAEDMRALRERVVRLGLGLAEVDDLAALPLPNAETAAGALGRIVQARDSAARIREAERDIREDIAIAQRRLHELEGDRPAPTEAVIASARSERDAEWLALRPLALGERAAGPEDRLRAERLDLGLAAADRLADERQTETARLAELARISRDLSDLDIRLSGTMQRGVDVAGAAEQALSEWMALWAGAARDIQPGDAAIALAREAAAILHGLADLRRRASSAAASCAEVDACRALAEDLRAELGLQPLGTAPMRMAEMRDAVARIEQRHGAARDHQRDLQRIARDAGDLEARRTRLADERAVLDTEAAELFPGLGLRTGAGASEIRVTINLWRDAGAALQKLNTAEHRIAQIEADEQRFRAGMESLLRDLGRTDGGDLFRAASGLRAALEDARSASSRAEHARQALADREGVLKRRTATLQAATAALAPALLAHGLPEPADLPDRLDRLQQAVNLDTEIARARERLAETCGTFAEAEIRAAVDGRTDDEFAVLIATSADAHQQARADLETAIETDKQARVDLHAFEGRTGAAEAAQQEQDAIAAVAEAMERFTRDHVAARLLSVAIDRYRQQHQDPIVSRASEVFSELTCGRWSGIGVDYDGEAPRLAAVRNGRLHGVEALSEGSADQLFLALRIAAIEDHAGRATPLPFVADDLLVTFDEARTEAGLKVLAELGRRTQVLVFTHHSHVVDCAVRALGDGVSVVRL
jgi:uncharacterized protein YhaN